LHLFGKGFCRRQFLEERQRVLGCAEQEGRDNGGGVAAFVLAEEFAIFSPFAGQAKLLFLIQQLFAHENSQFFLEEMAGAGPQFSRQTAHALLRIGAVGGASKIYFGIQNPMAALFAESLAVILEKFQFITAVRAGDIENCLAAPVPIVLSRALHDEKTSKFQTS
jgi:hypothetical protein